MRSFVGGAVNSAVYDYHNLAGLKCALTKVNELTSLK